MTFFDRFFGERKLRPAEAGYNAIVVRARMPHWYLDGGVPDTIDGRFDMIASVLSVVLLRLEKAQDGLSCPRCSLNVLSRIWTASYVRSVSAT